LKKKVSTWALADTSFAVCIGADPNDVDAGRRAAGAEERSVAGEAYSAILRRHYLDTMDASADEKPEPQRSVSARASARVRGSGPVDPTSVSCACPDRWPGVRGPAASLNPDARSQYHGGIIQGIGMALLEQTHLDRHLGALRT